MDANLDIKFYRDRWKAVEEIERQELGAHLEVAEHLGLAAVPPPVREGETNRVPDASPDRLGAALVARQTSTKR